MNEREMKAMVKVSDYILLDPALSAFDAFETKVAWTSYVFIAANVTAALYDAVKGELGA